ncbi:MAG: beta strand repeat-containing protein [Pirellula sp.]
MPDAEVVIFGSATLIATQSITLADTSNDLWTITGTTRIQSPMNVSLGQGGSWDSNRLEITAANATVSDINGVTIGNSQISGDYILNAEDTANIDGAVNVDGNWTIRTTSIGLIIDSDNARVNVLGNAILQSANAITLADTANASWKVGGTASLNAPANVSLGQGGSWDANRLEIAAVNAVVSDINEVTVGNSQLSGNYVLTAAGAVNVDGSVEVAGNWTITGNAITDSDNARVNVFGIANLRASNAIVLADTANSVWMVAETATLNTPSSVSLGQGGSWDADRLEINAASATVSDINSVTIGNSQISGNYVLNAAGTANIDAVVNVNGNWNIIANAIIDSDNARVNVLGNAVLQSSNAISLADTASASWKVGGTASLTTPSNASLGQGGLWDANRLEIVAVNALVSDINGVTIGNTQLSGNYVLNAAGTLNVDGAVNVDGNWNITTTNSGVITDSDNARVQVLGNAILQSASSITLADTANASWRVSGTANLSTPSSVRLGQGGSWDSSRLEIEAESAIVSDIDGVTIGDSQIFGSYVLNAAGNVIVDSRVNVGGDWSITTTQGGWIVDNDTARVSVLGNANLRSENSIELADTANASWKVHGTASLDTLGSVQLGRLGSWDTNKLSLFADNAFVRDVNGITLVEHRVQRDYELVAGGDITVSGAVSVGRNWDITATPTGRVLDTALANVRVAADLRVTTDQAITLAGALGSRWVVDGLATISTPADVQLGSDGYWDSAQLSIRARDAMVVDRTGVTLSDHTIGRDYRLTASGSIDSTSVANISVGGQLNMAGSSIVLAQSASNRLSVAGSAFIGAPAGQVWIGAPGEVQFGSVGVKGAVVSIAEDSAMRLDGVDATTLELRALDSISQSGVDTGAGVQAIVVRNNAHFQLDSAQGSIRLIRTGLAAGGEDPTGLLMDNSVGGMISASNVNGDFLVRNVSTTGGLGTVQGNIESFTLWQPRAQIVIGSTFPNVQQNLVLVAGMDVVADPTPGASHNIGATAPWRFVTSDAAGILDQGASFRVQGDATLLAGGAIRILDAVGESWRIENGLFSVVSLGGGDIQVGGAGTWQAKSFGFASQHVQSGFMGNVSIVSPVDLILDRPALPSPGAGRMDAFASELRLQVAGALDHAPGLTMTVGRDMVVEARDGIRLFNEAGSQLTVLGSATFQSTLGSMELGTAGQWVTGNVRAIAESGDIVLGNMSARMGELSLISNGVTVREGENTVLATAIARRELNVQSAGGIVNTQGFNGLVRAGVSTPQANLQAGTFIHMSETDVQRVNALARSNGPLSNLDFFRLNVQADRTGQAYLDTIGTNLPPNVPTNPRLISGETIAELKKNASYIQTNGSEYGIYLRNQGQIDVQRMTAFGNGTNVFLETMGGEDLVVSQSVQQVFEGSEPGRVVMIAGGKLILEPGAQVQVIQVSGNPDTARIVLQPQMVGSAFNGGQGPAAGFQSTEIVLYSLDAGADTGVQNILQRVSTQFGSAGERGFQILIQYADGKLQLFNNASEVYASLLNGDVGTNPVGTIKAYGDAGDAAVVQRTIPFSDFFLASNVMLPTTAIFRRSEELFLFENAGKSDLSLNTVDLTPAVDLVEDVLTPGRRISFPMTSEIRVTPQISTAEVRLVPMMETLYAIIDNTDPVRSITPKNVEVMIVQIGFDDANRDGQPDPSEVPSRDEIQVGTLDQKSSQDGSPHRNALGNARKKLAPGEIDLESRDVKESLSPTSADMQRWIEEYKSDPLKPSGVYAIISRDPATGTRILKVFTIRDFESDGTSLDRSDRLPVDPASIEDNASDREPVEGDPR